ncbi:MAG: NAD(P)-dependent oxidoreductase [Novosphingobium sp.]|jgi:nucleoside-diphosphate-sugar epimerase|nr:NAD(P)-dependent oxidoreductase [Novosphingobium sp.]
MTLLVTGGTGFLGSYLTRHALGSGAQDRVVVLDRYPDRSRIADVLDRVTLVEGDVGDQGVVEEVFAGYGIDRVAHFAFILGSPPPGRMPAYIQVQCQGTANVLEAARVAGVRRFLFASSVAAYGALDAAVLTEDLVPDPQVPYGFCKLWGEAMVNHYAGSLGLDAVSLRFGSTYGLGRGWRGSYNSGLMPPPRSLHYMARVESAARGQSIVMPADTVMADWTYAADAAQAAWLALTQERLRHRLYNVSSARLPVGQFTAALRAALPDAAITVDPEEPAGNAHAPMDNTRLVTDLGFVPAFDLAAGVADYLERIRIADACVAAKGRAS